MYVNPFLMGILCTVFFEIVAAFLWSLIFGRRYDDDEQEQEEQEHEDK